MSTLSSMLIFFITVFKIFFYSNIGKPEILVLGNLYRPMIPSVIQIEYSAKFQEKTIKQTIIKHKILLYFQIMNYHVSFHSKTSLLSYHKFRYMRIQIRRCPVD